VYVLYAICNGTDVAHLWAASENYEKLHEKAVETIQKNGLKIIYRDINTYQVKGDIYFGKVWIEKVEVI